MAFDDASETCIRGDELGNYLQGRNTTGGMEGAYELCLVATGASVPAG